MVKVLFGFKKTPISDSPDPKQVFRSQAWNQTKAAAVSGRSSRRRATHRRSRLGKFDCRPYLHRRFQSHPVLGLLCALPPRSLLDLLRQTGAGTGSGAGPLRRRPGGSDLPSHCALNQGKKQRQLLICDDARLLCHSTLGQLPLLVNFDMDSSRDLTLLLESEPLLRRVLLLQTHEPLRQHISVHYRLEGLSRERLDVHLTYQLRAAGVMQPPSDDTARQALYRTTKGVLRQVNKTALAPLYQPASRTAPHLEDPDTRGHDGSNWHRKAEALNGRERVP